MPSSILIDTPVFIGNRPMLYSFEIIGARIAPEGSWTHTDDWEIDEEFIEGPYVRFGLWRKNERSRNYQKRKLEQGVSVFETMKSSKLIVPKIGDSDTALSSIAQCIVEAAVKSRTPYIVRGDRIGTGGDGEPLLKNLEIVQELEVYKDPPFLALKTTSKTTTSKTTTKI